MAQVLSTPTRTRLQQIAAEWHSTPPSSPDWVRLANEHERLLLECVDELAAPKVTPTRYVKRQ